MYSRSGLNWTRKFSKIEKQLTTMGLQDSILDGEVVVLDQKGKSQFHLLQKRLKGEIADEMYYFVFDILFSDGEDLRGKPLWERKQLLSELLEEAPPNIFYLDHLTGHGKEFFKISCEEELEGIVCKEENSFYSSGRTGHWIKLKCVNRDEFIVGGWTEHSKIPGKIGALLLGEYKGRKINYVGKVGTGFTDKEEKDLRKKLKAISAATSPFTADIPKATKIHWVEPSIIVEVKFQNWTIDRILRGSVYEGIRDDKSIKEMQMLEEHISSPDKVIFKEEGITKEMIAHYYQEAGKEIIRLIKHRPLSVVRCPQGTSSKCFFQKHLDVKLGEGVNFFKVKDKEGINEYFSLSSTKGLLELVQLNAYEFHAWNSLDSDVDHPNQIVFDLDPDEGMKWNNLVWASFELKKLLEDLELESFVKLTGGKGIHVHVPIKDSYTWEEIKSFSYTIGKELTERYPKKFTTNMSKKARKGKIFIDYLRNAHGATAVIPYSIRVKEKATVALPIEWDELEVLGRGDFFGIEGALQKMKTRSRDPWMNYNRKKQKIIIFSP